MNCSVCVYSLFLGELLNASLKVVYLFQEGSITQVACCPHDEDFVAVATRSEFVHKIKQNCSIRHLVLFPSYLPLSVVVCARPVRVWWWCGSCSWSGAGVQNESASPGSTEVTTSRRSAGTPAHSEFLLGTLQEKCLICGRGPLNWER